MMKKEYMKKAIPFLAAAMMVISLSACGSSNAGGQAATGAEISTAVSASESTATGADNSTTVSASESTALGADNSTTVSAAESTASGAGNTTAVSAAENKTPENPFPSFEGTDFDGNPVDESIFSKNSVTVVNFWFNGCSACVGEMPALETFNQELKAKGAELVGINIEAGADDSALKEAKEILSKQGASYRNIALKEGTDIDNYIGKIYGYPTTVLVDRNGGIIGKQIMGSIDDEERLNEIMKMVDDAAAGQAVEAPVADDDTAESLTPEDAEIQSLIEEENALFDEHQEVWGKVFDGISKEDASSIEQSEYVNFLRSQIEKMKDQFTDEEQKLLEEDLTKIDEIEQKIQSVEAS